MTFPKGVFQVFKIDELGQLWFLDNEEATDHDDEIQSMDVDRHNHLIMTAGLDERIKIWNYSKKLVMSISVKESLHTAFFANNMGILIHHENKLSLLRHKKIRIRKEDV